MFRSQLFDHLQGAVFRAQCCYYFSACLRRQVVYLVCGCMLSMCVCACLMYLIICYVAVCCLCVCVCVCLMYLSVGCLVVHNQTSHRQVHHARTHTHRQHTATYQINNLMTQKSREGSNSTKHERRPPEDGQTIVTETCWVLMMCFTNIFNNLEF